MKKFLSTLAVLLAACLLLCSCGKKTKCSGQAVSVGKSAIEAADDYLDNNQSAHDALRTHQSPPTVQTTPFPPI